MVPPFLLGTVAQAVTVPNIPIPLSSGIFAIVMGVFSIAQAVFRHNYLVGEREKCREWLPNWGAIALVGHPGPVFSNAALIGAVGAAIWRKYSPRTWEIMAMPSLLVRSHLNFFLVCSRGLTCFLRLHRWRGPRRRGRRHSYACWRGRSHQGHQYCVPHELVLVRRIGQLLERIVY